MTEEPEHKMVGGAVSHEPNGIVAICTCGWRSREMHSSVSAALDFHDHVAAMNNTAKPGEQP